MERKENKVHVITCHDFNIPIIVYGYTFYAEKDIKRIKMSNFVVIILMLMKC